MTVCSCSQLVFSLKHQVRLHRNASQVLSWWTTFNCNLVQQRVFTLSSTCWSIIWHEEAKIISKTFSSSPLSSSQSLAWLPMSSFFQICLQPFLLLSFSFSLSLSPTAVVLLLCVWISYLCSRVDTGQIKNEIELIRAHLHTVYR